MKKKLVHMEMFVHDKNIYTRTSRPKNNFGCEKKKRIKLSLNYIKAACATHLTNFR